MIKLGAKKLITIVIVALASIGLSVSGILLINNLNKKDASSTPPLAISAWDGDGTESSPYLLYSISDMNTLSTNICNGNNYYGVYFKLMADLDYSNVSNFVPIGATLDEDNNITITDYDSFCGIFDGDGHIVSNLTTTVSAGSSYNEYVGFFAAIGSCRDSSIVYDGELSYKGDVVMLSPHTRVATVKNLKIQNFNVNCNSSSLYIGGIAGVSITESGTTNIGSDGLPDTNSYNSRTSWSYRYSTLIDQCIVEGLTVNCGGKYVHVSGLVGENWTKEGGENYSSTLGYAPGSLNITNCMVLDFDVKNYWYTYTDGDEEITTKGIITTIGPSYANCGVKYGSDFAYYYYISNCITDNSMFYTVNGSYSKTYQQTFDYAQNYSVHPDYYDSGKEQVSYIYYDIGQAWYLFYYASNCSSSYDKDYMWFATETVPHFVYLQQFLIQLEVKSSNETYGKVTKVTTCDPPVVPRGLTINLDTADLHPFPFYVADDYEEDNEYQYLATSLSLYDVHEVEATPTDSSKYKFVNWTVNETTEKVTYTANFETIVTYVNVTFKGLTGTTNTTNSTYQIQSGKQVSATFTTTLSKTGAYTTCIFSFTSKTGAVKVRYMLTDELKYISSFKSGSTSYTSSQTITISQATTFEVILSPRSYNANFS